MGGKMKEYQNKKIVQVTEQLQASYPYGKPGFPCEICMDDINVFYESTVNWHWQTELEFSYIYEGSLELQVLEKRYRIDERQGYLILQLFQNILEVVH